MISFAHLRFGLVILAGMFALPLWAVAEEPEQGHPQVSIADYSRAASFMGFHAQPRVDHLVRRVHWLDDTHFWYVDHDAEGDHYKLMDAASGKTRPAFDHQALAGALNALARAEAADETEGQTRATRQGDDGQIDKIKAGKLDIRRFRYRDDGRLQVTRHGQRYVCRLETREPDAQSCRPWRATLQHEPGKEPGVMSPNGKWAVFVRDWNLWLRNLQTGAERALTSDGVKNYGYATLNAGWVHGEGAIVRWSPDSSKLATYRQDQRKVGNMYMVETRLGHPKLHQWKYPLPGDEHVFLIEPVIIDRASGDMVRVDIKPQQRLSTLCDTLACDRGKPHRWSDVKWAPDGNTLAFVTTSRDRKHETFRIVDARTGKVRTVFEDHVKTFYESGRGMTNWQYLPEAGQAIWFSEASNWGNLYLRDLDTGKVLHAMTEGPGNVAQVRHLDRAKRTLWFVGNARTRGINPYYRQFFKVDIDTGKTTLLTPEAADHVISMSPGGTYFVDSYSTVNQPPITVLRSATDGEILATVARADISRLEASGWQPPEVIQVTARDGKTTLYGLLFKPTDFNPQHRYPIIDYIYPGPQTGSVRSFGWRAARGDRQAMAELGFIVVAINGMGTPWRTKRFHDTWYGNMGDNTLPDQVAAIQQLAARHDWIDIERVGIWGHSGGGNATAGAMFRYPDLFKVGWAESGNHDNRNYENDWGEKYQGLLVTHEDGSSNYDNQANQRLAKNLKGKLMLVHGALDDNVPLGSTMLVVKALIDANKDFDLLILPGQHHGYGEDSTYVTRRRWDYFVRHLLGAEPPDQFKLERPDR